MNLSSSTISVLAAIAAIAANTAAGAAAAGLDAAASRCIDFSELVSCAAALGAKPNDPRLLIAEGEALVQSGRPGEAIGVYRNAVRSGASQNSVSLKIAVAQERRQSLLHECETETGAAAARACESAWLPGAPDEIAVFKRRGLLLQSDNQPDALGAYLAAARLAPRDREVARAVVALSGSTENPDPATLRARGAALLILGRPADAILALREALRLAPDDDGTKVRLRKAEGLLAAERHMPPAAAGSTPVLRTSAQDNGAFSNEAPPTQSN